MDRYNHSLLIRPGVSWTYNHEQYLSGIVGVLHRDPTASRQRSMSQGRVYGVVQGLFAG